jgi:hypothetical protein
MFSESGECACRLGVVNVKASVMAGACQLHNLETDKKAWCRVGS